MAFNDDFNGSEVESQILNFTLPSSGTYTIVVGSYQDSSAGNYTLNLTLASVPTNPTLAPTAQFMTVGQSVAGSVQVDSIQRWTFNGQAGQIVTIDVTGNIRFND